MRTGKSNPASISTPTKSASCLIMPDDILKDKKLCSGSKLILSIILTKEKCTVQELANLTGNSVQGIHYFISKLKKTGVILFNDGLKYFLKDLKYFLNLEKSVYNTIRLTYEVSKDCSITKLVNSKDNPEGIAFQLSTNSNAPVPSPAPTLFMGQRVRQHLRDQRPAKPKIKTEPDPILEKIMAMPNLPRHRQGTKAYANTSAMLKSLQEDLFQTVPLDKAWAEHFAITPAVLKTRWPAFQILATFQTAALAYAQGYRPEDKSTLPKSVADIIYNPRSRKSLFLKAHMRGTDPASKTAERAGEKKLSPRASTTVRIFKAAIIAAKGGGELSQDESLWILQIAKNIIQEHDERIRFADAWDCLLDLVEDYAGWIKDEHSGRLQAVRWLGPGTSDWRRYSKSRGLDDIRRPEFTKGHGEKSAAIRGF